MVTCAQCRKVVLEADLIGDEEECALRDQRLAVHPNTVQPEDARGVAQALRHHRTAPAGSVGSSSDGEGARRCLLMRGLPSCDP